MEEIRVSVRTLVEFILRHGDIDNRHHSAPDQAMQEGGRIHRMIQRRMGPDYEAEVTLRYSWETSDYCLVVEGRADGVFSREGRVILDEIKGTYRELSKIKAPMPEHLAQAKCYAYMYALREGLDEITVRMTYCNMSTEEIRYFYEDATFEELKIWFEELLGQYQKWADNAWQWKMARQASIQGLSFPFPYREGQKELVKNVYSTIYHKKKLFLEAPTGVGKTIATIYPALQAMGREMGDKLFYLTAKTITRTVAADTFSLLREQGLKFRSVILTAKEKICFMDEANCNPEACPYANGHYDRINDAVFDLLTSEESFSREIIEEYARKHSVCPFEMCLDLTLFADGIICDYNYLFDPHVYLKRFFAGEGEGNYLFLIDEAHNLLERGREMYSAILWKEQFLELKKILKTTIVSEATEALKKRGISGQIMMDLPEDLTESSGGNDTEISPGMADFDEIDRIGTAKGKRRKNAVSVLVKDGWADKMIYWLEKCNAQMLALKRECEGYCILEEIDLLVHPLLKLHADMEAYLQEQEEKSVSARDDILDFYFEIRHFLEMYELLDEHYVTYAQICEDGSFFVKLFCVNPRENLKNCMKRGRSSILFSATFLPIQYYKQLLGGDEEDYEVYAQSVFNPEKRALLIANDVTSKYTRRSEDEFFNIALYIDRIVKRRQGNYMVFCPSYAFLNMIYAIYSEAMAGEGVECIIQGEMMSEAQKEEFLARFRESGGGSGGRFEGESGGGSGSLSCSAGEVNERTLVGFCVLGGIFSEGIDLKNDSLIGAIIVGTGLPQVCFEREILKQYFDAQNENGFDYAYRYPGMNKVLQAAGRVIRTSEDLGVIALLDERFLQYAYRRMFPREWENAEVVSLDTVGKRVDRFWNEWL